MAFFSSLSTMTSSTLILPAQDSKYMLNHSEAPPSPSTSSNHSSSLGKNKARDLSASAQRKYGSIDNCTPYLDSITSERPLTPSQTTIGQSDDDESLYLQWTHQLLRERGFTPSSCRPETEEDYQEAKFDYLDSKHLNRGSTVDGSDDSSVSDMSFSSDDEDEENEHDIDHYIAEQRRLLMASPSPSFVFYRNSPQPSMMSGYTTNNTMTDLERNVEHSSDTDQDYSNRHAQNPIEKVFSYFFSCCL